MPLHSLLLILLAVAFFIGVPVAGIWLIVDLSRSYKSERRGGSGSISAFVGAGLTEIDRLLARPSVEHQIETENAIQKREDDQGGA